MAIYSLYHLNQFQRMTASTDLDTFISRFFHCFSVFSTGLVRLYIALLPLRSCETIGAPSVQGSAQCLFFRFWQQQDSKPRPGDDHANVLPLLHFDPQNIEWVEWSTSCNGTTVHPPLLNNCVYIYICVCVKFQSFHQKTFISKNIPFIFIYKCTYQSIKKGCTYPHTYTSNSA